MHHQTTPPFVLEYVQLPTIHDYAIQQFDIGPQLPAVFMMVGPTKPGENIPARRYSITELLAMKSSLPYVSCPLNRFKPDAWTENLLYRKRVRPSSSSIVELPADSRYRFPTFLTPSSSVASRSATSPKMKRRFLTVQLASVLDV